MMDFGATLEQQRTLAIFAEQERRELEARLLPLRYLLGWGSGLVPETGLSPTELERLRRELSDPPGSREFDVQAATRQLARDVADSIRNDNRTTAERSEFFRPRLEELGLVRHDSLDASALRRFQEFLSKHVYGKLIPDDELPPRIQSGRTTGGRPERRR